MAQQQDRPRRCQPKPAGIKRGGNGRLDADLQRKVDELKERARQRAGAQQEKTMPAKAKMTRDEIVAAHRRYVLEDVAVRVIAETTALTETPLIRQFKKNGLPVRGHTGWTAEEIEQICQVHKLTADDIPGNVRAQTVEPVPEPNPEPEPDPTTDTDPLAATVVWRAGAPLPAAVPNGEQKPAPAPRAVAANGHTAPTVTAVDDDDSLDIGEQLALLSDLLANANAQSVKLTGWISIQLQAEVVF